MRTRVAMGLRDLLRLKAPVTTSGFELGASAAMLT